MGMRSSVLFRAQTSSSPRAGIEARRAALAQAIGFCGIEALEQRTLLSADTLGTTNPAIDASQDSVSVVLLSHQSDTEHADGKHSGTDDEKADDTPTATTPPADPSPIVSPIITTVVTLPVVAVDAAPAAVISPIADITQAGDTAVKVTVTYTDDVAINLATIDVNDISVSGAGATLPITGVQLSTTAGGQQVTATYTLAIPGGSWDSADNGAYAVTLNAGQVTDLSGNAAVAATRSFDVSIATPVAPVDTGFAGGLLANDFVAEGTVTQSDGKILIVGHTGSLVSGTSRYVVKRLNADGSADAAFGSAGVVQSADGGNNAAYAIALLSDGSILLAGAKGTDLAVTKLKKTGAIDTKFGNHGQAATDLGGTDDAAYAVAVAADGSVIAGGGSSGGAALVKYARDGRNGQVIGALGSAGVIGGLALQGDGHILAAGTANGAVAVYRFSADGSADATFATAGVATVASLAARPDAVAADHTVGIALQADGKILVGNQSSAGGDFAIARLTADGAADVGFGSDGVAMIDFGGDDDVDAVLVQGSGQIFALGTTNAGGSAQTAVAALTSQGRLDGSFGAGGKFTASAGVTDSSRALHLGDLILRAFGGVQGDGKLVVGTSEPAAPQSTSALRRLNVPGSGSLGRFGVINGHRVSLNFTADGTVAVIKLKGAGAGQAFYDGSQIDLKLTGTDASTSVSIQTRGGDGRIILRQVTADGALNAFTAKAASLAGTFAVDGNLAKIALGGIAGTLLVKGSIGTVQTTGDISGVVLAGADYGSDTRIGGTGAAADAFAAASIGAIKVGGKFAGALIAAGVDPVDGEYLNADDAVLGGTASSIGLISARGIDDSTDFIAGAFRGAKLPGAVDVSTDGHFHIL